MSSFGRLSTGERYFVYRFVQFSDGFESRAGKEASSDGVYLLCLNFATRRGRTPNDVRILSLAPPGVKADAFLTAIIADVVEGMTKVFLDVNAEGNMRPNISRLGGICRGHSCLEFFS